MLKKGLLFFLLTLFALSSFSQKVKVVDKNTGDPIDHVMIYNLNFTRAVPTGADGIGDIADFDEKAVLYFQHPAYHEFTMPKASLTDELNIIELNEKILSIDELIISASKWEQNPENIPNKVATIKSREIKLKNPPTSADMLQESGQVFVQKSQLGGGSPMLRGFAANSVLLVVDGVRMNNAIFRSGNLQNVINIDVNALQEAEVLFGPGSVMYGSDALGGVMDFHIRESLLLNEQNLNVEGNGLVRYSTAANEKTVHADIAAGGKKIGSYTSLSYTDFDDLRAGSHRPEDFPDFGKRNQYVIHLHGIDTIMRNKDPDVQKFSGYAQYGLIQKLKYRPTGAMDINYGFYFSSTSDIPRYDRLILEDENGLPENAEWYYGPQTWLMNRVQARLYKSNPLLTEGKITLSHQFVKESRHDRAFRSDFRRSRIEKLDILTLNADFDKNFNDKHQLFYGLEMAYNYVDSEASRLNIETGSVSPASTRYPDGGSQYYFGALYGNHQWKINQNSVLNSGVRYTYTGLKAAIEDQTDLGFEFDRFSNFNGAFNGSIGLVLRPLPSTKLDFVLSSGFRAPNVDDVGKLFDSEPGHVVVPNKDLDPEYSYNGELGITQRLNGNFQVHAVGFYTRLVDAMVRRDFTFSGQDSIVYDGELKKVQALVNTGKAYIYGFSVVLQGDLSRHWGLFSSLTVTEGQDLIDDEPLRHTPPPFGRTALYYKRKNWLAELYTQYSGGRKIANMAPSERNKSHLYTSEGALGWYTLNLKASYTLGEHFNINAGVENIFDYHYRPYSSGISAPGRNFIIGLRAAF